MSVELATAYVSVIPSTQGMAGKLRQEMGPQLEQAGEEGGQQFGGGLTSVAGKVAKTGGLAAAAGFGLALTKGFGRLRAIDDARFKLEGLGHDAEAVERIMSSANDSVLGTAFGLDEAATIAAAAVAAGVEPGDELTRTLSLTGDAASIAGTSLGEMGAIFGKVGASNRMMTQEMNQLQDRGLPVLSWLQDEYGITAEAAREMVSNGEVDFGTFQRLMENNIGGAALKAGESFRGSFANMGAALGRFGAVLLGPIFAVAPTVFGKITDALNTVTGALGPLVERFSGPLAVGMAVVAGVITAVLVPAMIAWAVQATLSAARTAVAWTVAQLASIKGAAAQAVAVVRVVAGWVLMGVQSLLAAAKMAAAWFIALGPVGWVIAAVVALVALIIANWDTVVDWTRKAWTWVTDKIGEAWDWIKATTASAVASVVAFFVNLRNSAVEKVGNLRDRVVTFFGNLRDRAVSIVSGLLDSITGFFGDIRDNVVTAAKELAADAILKFIELKDGAIEKGEELLAWVKELPGNILSAIGDLGSLLLGVGKDIVQGLIDGIGDMAGAAGSAIRGVVDGAISSAKNALGISSPSRVFMDIGHQIGDGLVGGIGDRERGARRAGASLVGATVPARPVLAAASTGAMAAIARQSASALNAVSGAGARHVTLQVGERQFDAYLHESSRKSAARHAVRTAA